MILLPRTAVLLLFTIILGTNIYGQPEKVLLYKSYMLQLDAGVQKKSLPANYITVLAPFFTPANINNWQFGYSSRQPEGNATTDCSVTYFNDQAFVEKLAAGTLSTDAEFRWLFHELQHFVQCTLLGNRDAYAQMWFGQMDAAFIRDNDLATIHDRLPMESLADARAIIVLSSTDIFRDESGFLSILPSVNIMHNNQAVTSTLSFLRNTQLRFTANGSGGGHDPLRFTWHIKPPGQNNFSRVNGTGTEESVLQYTPRTLGDYQLKVVAKVPGTILETEKTINLRADVNENEVPVVGNRPANVYYRGDLPANFTPHRLTVNINRTGGPPYPPINICVHNGLTQTLYWQGLIYSSQATFNVPRVKRLQITLSRSGYTGVRKLMIMPPNGGATTSMSIARGNGGPLCIGMQ